jgi:signal transduction histidine kinase
MDLALAARSVGTGLEEGGLCPAGQINVDAPAPVTGNWDAIRIEQVLTNLCSNAIKYGEGKPIQVRVRKDVTPGCARLEVIDHGVGIEPGMLQKIFDPFQRAACTKHIEGLGLGLFVVRSIVESHGGRVQVQSERGHGSQFIIELPCGPLTTT